MGAEANGMDEEVADIDISAREAEIGFVPLLEFKLELELELASVEFEFEFEFELALADADADAELNDSFVPVNPLSG